VDDDVDELAEADVSDSDVADADVSEPGTDRTEQTKEPETDAEADVPGTGKA